MRGGVVSFASGFSETLVDDKSRYGKTLQDKIITWRANARLKLTAMVYYYLDNAHMARSTWEKGS